MIKISGKVDKPKTDSRINILFFIGNRTSSKFPIKSKILNPLSVLSLSTFLLLSDLPKSTISQ